MGPYGLLVAIVFVLAVAIGIYKWYTSEFETINRNAKAQAIRTRQVELSHREELTLALGPALVDQARALGPGKEVPHEH